MNRRAYLSQVSSAAAIIALAGCGTNNDQVSGVEPADVTRTDETPVQNSMTPPDTTEPTGPPPSMELSTAEADPTNADARLSIAWRARVQSRSAPVDRDTYTIPNDGNKFVVVQCRFDCTEGSVQLHTGLFRLNAGDEERQPIVADDGDYSLSNEELSSGETLSRYLLFQVPWDVREGTLVFRQPGGQSPIAASWSHDSSLQFGARA